MSDDKLRLHVEAIETLNEQAAEVAEEIKDRYALAKAEGFDTKILRAVISRRAKEREELRIYDETLRTYEAALSE